MLSLSPSIVSSFEYWLSIDDDKPDLQTEKLTELIAQIKGEPFEPSDELLLGRAFHEALETTALNGKPIVVDAGLNTYAFAPEAVDEIQRAQPAGTIRELPSVLCLEEIGVVMRLRIDGIAGTEIREVKTVSRIDPARYVYAIQWQCYLLAFGARSVVYDLCRLRPNRETNVYELAEHVAMRQFAYPGMRKRVVSRVDACKRFVIEQGLEEFRHVDSADVAQEVA